MELLKNPETWTARFWERVNIVDDHNSCWEWMRGRTTSGYGAFTHHGYTHLANRIAYGLFFGDPGELCVCHKCDNRKCCRPAHLVLATRLENNLDKTLKGRQAKGPEHGVKGEAVASSKLDEAQVREIRALRASGYGLRDLAKMFRIAGQTASKICLRHTWRHI